MKCPRGWILCQNNEGFTVPYFVKVRAIDVCVSNAISDKFGYAGILSTDLDKDNITILPAGQTFMVGIQGWRVWLNNNETFKMSKTFSMDVTNAEVIEQNMIRMHITLPFKVITNDVLSIQLTKKFMDKRLIKSFDNIVYGAVSIDKDMTDFYVELYLTENVTDDFLNESDVVQSQLTVIVDGTAQLGKYSHMDEKGQIGGSWNASSSGGVNPATVYTKEEVNAMIRKIRNDVESGALIGPREIVDVVDNVTDSVVLPKGIVFDVETPEEVAADEEWKRQQKELQKQQQEQAQASTQSISEDDEIQKMINDEGIAMVDMADLGMNFDGDDNN